MGEPTDARIARMYTGDCAWALIALLTLWATIAFVFYKIWMLCDDRNIMIALAAGAAVLLTLNTASIIALVYHYTTDKRHLYGLDLHYLDAMRSLKGASK